VELGLEWRSGVEYRGASGTRAFRVGSAPRAKILGSKARFPPRRAAGGMLGGLHFWRFAARQVVHRVETEASDRGAGGAGGHSPTSCGHQKRREAPTSGPGFVWAPGFPLPRALRPPDPGFEGYLDQIHMAYGVRG
jgi:hypothetical protein